MKKSLLLLPVLLLLLAGTVMGQSYSDFSVEDINGNEVTLSSYLNNGPVMLSFWATWCTPCKEELKKMQPLYELYKDKGFTYLAVSIDDQKTVSKVSSLINAQGYTFPVVSDIDKKIFEAYGGTESDVPYYVLISKDKNVVLSHLGFKTGDEVTIEKEIKKLLGLE